MKHPFNIYIILAGLFFLVACEPENEPTNNNDTSLLVGEYYGSVSRFVGNESIGTTIGPGMVNFHSMDTSDFQFIFQIPGILQDSIVVAHQWPANTSFHDITSEYELEGTFYTEQQRMWLEYSFNDTTYTFGGVKLY